MSVALISRPWSTVEHLGIYAYDRSTAKSWRAGGRYVPICGSERNHTDRWPITHHLTYEGDARLTRKPLCTRCARLLTELVTLAEGDPDA